MPYSRLNEGFGSGKMLIVDGVVTNATSRMIFDVLNADHKVAFHMHVRFPEKVSIYFVA